MQTDDVARSTVDASAGRLLAIMADVDTVSGYLLAGIGDASATQGPNFFVVSNTTSRADMETAFRDLSSREDVAGLHEFLFVRSMTHSYFPTPGG